MAEIESFYGDLSLDKLRVNRPSKFMFLCGGVIVKDSSTSGAENLRDYIHRVRPLRLEHPTILAEDAIQLFRDSDYADLISFEEDLARIAAIVVVIAESAGSLAELGAFASNDTIRRVLRIILRKDYEEEESFIRYGPVERVKNEKRSHIGVYPWKMSKDRLIVSSIKPHYNQLQEFIVHHLSTVPQSLVYNSLGDDSKLFYLIYWVIYICMAISKTSLIEYVRLIEPSASNKDINRKLYCMILAKWVKKEAYSDKDYYYACYDVDVFEYSFRTGTANNEPIRRKLAVYTAHNCVEKLPSHIRSLVTAARKGSRR